MKVFSATGRAGALIALALMLAACASPPPGGTGSAAKSIPAAPRSPELQRAVQAVESFHASRGSWPVSLSQVGVGDRALSYEANAAGCRISDSQGGSYDSTTRR
ncbi:MAG: hypothetical protein JWO82_4365 [Akkermansiaceae bacterium]|nr:hypothetical protein [Akkermansiaceae bacterium]